MNFFTENLLLQATAVLPGSGVGSKRALIPLASGDVSGFTTKDVHGFISQAPRSILESHRAFNLLAMMP